MREAMVGQTILRLERGSVVRFEADAIVNAANEGLYPGGGVSGAIHEAGGPEIARECERIGQTPTGSAAITTAGMLPARYVIHAVGPIWRGGDAGEADLLASAYRSSLRLADEYRLETVAFPSISTGIFGYPRDLAVGVAIRAVVDHLRGPTTLKRVTFVFFGPNEIEPYARALDEVMGAR